MTPSRQRQAAALAYLALCLVLFRDVVFSGRVLFKRDISLWWVPQVEDLVHTIAAGSWPLWDPYRGFGQPLLADPSAEVLYPPAWLNLVLEPWTCYTVFALGHLVLSALGLFALARRWGVSPPGAFVGGAVWMLSGPLFSLVSLPHHLAGAAWTPWVLLAGERALDERSAASALLWGAAAAGQILAGSADMVAMTGLTAGACLVLPRLRWGRRTAGWNLSLAAATAGAAAFAVALTAALWVPTLAVAEGSARWGLPAGTRTTWSLHPLGLLEVVLRFHWNDVALLPTYAASVLDFREPWLTSIYLGVPALGLVLAALCAPARPRRGALAALGAGAVLVALGRHSAAYGLLVDLLPPLRILRFPVKAMVIAALAWALLAGIGFDAWRGAVPASRRRRAWGVLAPLLLLAAIALAAALAAGPWAEELGPMLLWRGSSFPSYSALLAATAAALAGGAAGAGGALLLAVRFARPEGAGRGVALALAAIALTDLAAAGWRLHPTAPKALFTHRPEVLGVIERSDAPVRLYVYDYSMASPAQRERQGPLAAAYELARAPLGWSRGEALVLGVLSYLNPPTAGRWGLYGSYDRDMLELSSKAVAGLTELLRAAEGTPLHLRLLRLGAVDYVLALQPAAWWRDLEPVAEVPGFFRLPVRVFRVPDALPRSYAVGAARVADGAAALDLLADPGFDPGREIVLPQGPARAAAGRSGRTRITLLEPDRVRIDATLDTAGYVVLVDGYDPGWRAEVDGRPTTVLRANVAFRAVAVPAGRHLVEFVYRPRPVLAGLLVSAGALGVALAVALSRRRRRS